LSHLGMSLGVVGALTGISGVMIGQFWLSSFTPRRITVFEDHVEIKRFYGRGGSTRSILYSDIQGVEVESYKAHYLATLQLKAQPRVMLLTPDLASADRIRDTFEKYNSVPNKSLQATPTQLSASS
jgi:hypothetical protein